MNIFLFFLQSSPRGKIIEIIGVSEKLQKDHRFERTISRRTRAPSNLYKLGNILLFGHLAHLDCKISYFTHLPRDLCPNVAGIDPLLGGVTFAMNVFFRSGADGVSRAIALLPLNRVLGEVRGLIFEFFFEF